MRNIIAFGKRLIILMLAFLIPAMCLSQVPASQECLGIITEINGEVLLKKVNSSDFSKAVWGSQLFQGDLIKTSEKSEVKVLFSNSNLISLGPNSTLRISGKESPQTETQGNIRKLSSATLVDLSAFSYRERDKKDAGALAGTRSITIGQSIELISPYNTLLKTNRPSFSWTAKKSFDNYIINLYNSNGLVWKTKASESSISYPENEKELDYGETYFWNVEGEYLVDTEKSANHKFSVMSMDKSKEVEKDENLIRDAFKNDPESSSLHSVLGAYYINKGLLQDAISEFLIISKINTDVALPHEILGSLYSETGEKDKAIDELQKALTLSKNKDR